MDEEVVGESLLQVDPETRALLEAAAGIRWGDDPTSDNPQVDPESRARLEKLLEAAGLDNSLIDPEVLRRLTSSVSSALDEAAAALTRMRQEQQQQQMLHQESSAATGSSSVMAGGVGTITTTTTTPGGTSTTPGMTKTGSSSSGHHHPRHPVPPKGMYAKKGGGGNGGKTGGGVTNADNINSTNNNQPSSSDTSQRLTSTGGIPESPRKARTVSNSSNPTTRSGHSNQQPAQELNDSDSDDGQEDDQGDGGGGGEEEEDGDSCSLIDACSDGDLEQVKRLLEEGRNVNEMTEEGESLLSLACSSGYLELAQLLLATRANVEDRGLKDTTPLMEAASTGNLAIVQLLLDHGADVNAQTTQGNTPLMYAASNCGPGSDEIVRLLLDNGANVSDCNENGHTPLMEAASAGNVAVAKILVESGASINTHSNEFKESALTLACYKGHLEMVRFLLEAGADQEHKTEEMHTALMEASMDGHVAVARLLLDSGAQVNMPADSFESPLTLAACGGHVELAMLLLERGANIEEVNDEGYTPLMEASREGHEEMVALLLSQGADINAQTEETQETALTLACCGGFLEVADFLIKAGADIEAGANTPLAEASQEGHIDLVRHLIEAGGNIHATSATGDTPLMYAAENGHTDVVQVLLEAGASIEHEAEAGRTPLMKAARAGHLCTVQFLVSRGANVNKVTTNNDHTPLSLACAGGHMAVVEYLLANGADSTHRLKDNSTMLIEAAKGGHAQVVQLLIEHPSRSSPTPPVINEPPPLPPLTSTSSNSNACPARMPGIVNPLSSDPQQVTNASSASAAAAPTVVPGRVVNTDQLIENAIQWSKQRKAGIKKPKLPDPNEPESVPVSTKPASGLDKKAAMDGVAHLIKSMESPESSAPRSVTPPESQSVIVEQQTTMSAPSSEADRALKETERLEQCINNMMKRTEMLNPSREEQILQKQQILEELQRVEKELQEKAQQQLLLSAAAPPPQTCSRQAKKPTGSNVRSGQAPAELVLPPLAKALYNALGENQGADPNWSLAEVAELRRRYLTESGLDPNSPFGQIKPVDPTSSTTATPSASCADSNATVPTTVSTQVRRSAKKAKKKLTGSSACGPSSNFGLESLTESVDKMNLKNSNEVALAIASHPQQAEILNQLAANLNQVKKTEGGPSSFRPVLEAAGIVPPSTGNQILVPPAPFSLEGTDIPPEAMDQFELARNFCQTSQSTQTVPLSLPGSIGSNSFTGTITSDSKSLTLTLATAATSGTTGSGSASVTTPSGFPALTNQQLQLLKSQLAAAAAQAAAVTNVSSSDPSKSNLGANFNSALVSLSASLSATTLSQQNLNQSALTDQDMESQLEAFQATLAGQEMTDEQKSRIKEQIQKMNQSMKPEYMQSVGFEPNVPRGKMVGSSNVASQTLPTDGNVLFNAADSTTGTVGPGSLYEPTKTRMPNATGTISSSSSCSAVSNTNSSNTTSSSVPSPPPFFSHSIEIDGQTDSNHDTALTLSCAGGHDELVSLLLSRGANCEHRDKKGFTPLMLAATAGHASVCEILLGHGVDIEAQSERTKDTALSLACSSGRYEVVELLLSRGANKEHRNVSDYTPLSLAASGGYVNIIKLLLNHGAEINSRTGSKLGISPLMLAAMNGHAATVKLLLDMGSDINAQIETNRNTALTLACFQGRCEVVSLLLDRKANVEHRAKTGLTPLMEAASGGYVEVGRILLDKGADVNAPPVPSSRDTALTIAADKGHYRFVELLIKRGGQALNLDARNKKGSSPLWLAANGGHLDVVQLLVNSGADIDAQDNRKVSCLMSAFRKGHIKVVKWMVKHVTQFPSDQEMTRTLALVNDKEMLKKCNQCMDVIRLAKEKQAAEANKNATILLEELESERIRAENKKAKLASKREKKKAKKKEKKVGKGGESVSTNGSKSSKDGQKKGQKKDQDSSSESDDDDIDDEDPSSSYDDHLAIHDPVAYQPEIPIPPPVVLREITVTATKKAAPVTQASTQKRPGTSELTMSPAKDSKKSRPVQVVEVSTTTITATTMKSNKESMSNQSSAKSNQTRKSSVPSVTIEPVVIEPSKPKKAAEAPKPKQQTSTNVTTKKNQPRQVTPPGVKHAEAPRVPTPSSPATKSSSRQSSSAHHSSSHVSSTTKYDSESEWPIGNFDHVGTWGTGATSSASNEWKPVKQTAAGWKEVTRRSKKVAVPSTAISRVIGRGGCNINAVREISGAHIEVEKQKGQQSDRQILIKGTQDATRNAQLMINALVNEPDKDLNQIIASLGLSKPIDSGSNDHFMTDSSVFERIPSAGFSSTVAPASAPSVPVSSSSTSTSSSRSKVTSSTTSGGSGSVKTSSNVSSGATASSSMSKESTTTKIGVFNPASVNMSSSSSSGSSPSGVVRTNKPVPSSTTPAFTSTWANKSQSPRPGIVAAASSSNKSGQVVVEKSTTPSPFGSSGKMTSQVPFAPKSPSSSAAPGSPPSAAASQYTPFNDTFGKVTSSVWGSKSSQDQKVNFANIVKGSLTSAAGEMLPGSGTSSQGSPGAIHVHPSASPDLNIAADQSKAPGFRGPNYASPGGMSSHQQQQQQMQQNMGLGSFGNFGSGHRSAPCSPPPLAQMPSHPVQQMSPESRPVQESSPQLRSTSSNAADHFGAMYGQQSAPFSPGGSKNFSLAPGSRPQVNQSYNQGYNTPSSYMMDTGRGQSPIDSSDSGLNPNAPSYAPDSPAGQAQARLLNNLTHTNNLLRTASMQPSGMGPPGSMSHQQQQQSQMNRPFETLPNPQLQMQMRAAILAAGASLQMQAAQQQQQRFMQHQQQPPQPSLLQQQQMAYNSLSGPDFAPASAETLRLLHTALLNTTSNISSHYSGGSTQSMSNHGGVSSSGVSSGVISRPTAGVIGAGRKISTQTMSLDENNDPTGGDSSPEGNKSVPRPIGTERAQKTKNPYSAPSPGIIGSTNFGTTSDNLWNMDVLPSSGHSGMIMSDTDWMMAGQVPPSAMDQSFMSNLLSQSYSSGGNSGMNRGYIDPTFGADPLLGAAMNGAAAGMMGGHGSQQQAMGGGHPQAGLGGLPSGFGIPNPNQSSDPADYWTGKLPLGGYHDNTAKAPTSNATSWYNHY